MTASRSKAKHGFGSRSVFAPISNYRVAMVALGARGTAYMGVNLEFEHLSLAETVHGEQFATISAVLNNDTGVTTLASAGDGSPCGHCRYSTSMPSQPPPLYE